MTDQRQHTPDQWTTPSVPHGPEQAGPDWTGPASSTQNGPTADLTDPQRPAEDGTVYESAAHGSGVDGAIVEEPHVDATAVAEPGVTDHVQEQAVDGGEGFDPVERFVPAGDAGPDHPGAGYAVGMASLPETEPDAGTADRGGLDSPDVAAQDAVQSDGPDGTYGLNGHGADAPTAQEEPNAGDEPDGVVTDTGPPMHDADERADLVAGGGPIVAPAGDDTTAPDVNAAGQLLPGEMTDEPDVALFDHEMTERYRVRWQRLQTSFVDDPKAAAGLAGELVDEVVSALRDSMDRQRSALEEWQSGNGVDGQSEDTERLRVAVRHYRHFLNRLLDV
jgi:hypothetical protein